MDYFLLLYIGRNYLSITTSELSVVPTPNWAREEKQGHHKSPPLPLLTALPSVSPPPLPPPTSPSFSLHPWCSIFCWEAEGGRVELFCGINGNSAQSKLPECSCLVNALLCSQLCCLCCVQCQAKCNSCKRKQK